RSHYVSLDNRLLRNRELSWGARGLLAYLLSQPDGWEVRNGDLINQSPAGEHAVKSILRELKEHNYLFRFRVKVAGGLFRWISIVSETPLSEADKAAASTVSPSGDFHPMDSSAPSGGFPSMDEPSVDDPSMDGPPMENHPIYELPSQERLSKERLVKADERPNPLNGATAPGGKRAANLTAIDQFFK
ncbi:MAG: hypothetical protein ABIP75_03225, partial [Pyrinomonadaceae bacterium]